VKAERQPAKKAKFDLTKKRPDWVKGSVSEAVRSSEGTSGTGAATSCQEVPDRRCGGEAAAAATAAVAAPRETAAVASAAAGAVMTAVAVAGVQRPEVEEATGAVVTVARGEAALGESELCFPFFSYEIIN
jgi:hypothetical protein